MQYLAAHAANSPSLRVACPICRTDYQIEPSKKAGASSLVSGWRELFGWSSTDQQLLLRHARFFFLVAPLIGSSLLAWTWLGNYWEDYYRNGPGDPLMREVDTIDGRVGGAPPLFKNALEILSNILPRSLAESYTEPLLNYYAEVKLQDELAAAGAAAAAAKELAEANAAGAVASFSPEPHPAGISKNWSHLYVWLQYAQWYKVLAWLMVLVVGGSEGLLPQTVREAFRVEELLLASDTRAQVFILGQCIPFILTKTRHFLVTWAGSQWLTRIIFYRLFTSHVEVAATLACDSMVAMHLLWDWAHCWTNDYSLRQNLARLRSGYFAIASRKEAPRSPNRRAEQQQRPHAD